MAKATAAAKAPAWRNRIVGSGEADPAELVPNERNWRTHPKGQVDALEGALGEVGWVQQVIVNRTTGRLVDGHARVASALRRHEPAVPVVYVELTEAEEALVLASLDPIGALAGTDQAMLDGLLADVSVGDEGLRRLLGDLASPTFNSGLTDPDDAPELPAEPWVKPGDLFALGDHRLLVGDCTDQASVELVGGGIMADLLWTDPPYGVSYVGKTGDALTITNDDLTPEATLELVQRCLELAPLRKGGVFYICSPAVPLYVEFALAVRGAGLHHAQNLVWVKDRFVLGRSDFHYRHEPILHGWALEEVVADHDTVAYGWREGARHTWAGGRKLDTVWEVPRPSASKLHPTMKPVDLVARALEYSSLAGDVVYDPFVGSGTTIIAAEQLGRRAIALELDPRYAQVALERWQAFTGREAVRVDA